MNRIKRVGSMFSKAVAAGVLLASAGLAQALPLPFPAFEGRNADGSVNNTCTATGAGKCVMIYNSTLDITILNDWNIGTGFWSATAVAGSAQALAESAGFAATGLTGWMLPTGDGVEAEGALNQFLSIWNDVGGTLAGLQSEFDGVQSFGFWSGSEFDASLAWVFNTDVGSTLGGLQSEFDGVQAGNYWSGSEYAPVPIVAWLFSAGFGSQNFAVKNNQLFAVAVRSGDVVAAVPEPESLALVLVGLMAAGVARRRRPL